MDSVSRKRIGEILRIHRMRNGLSVADLAADLGMKIQTLIRLESGTAKSHAASLNKVCERLGISVQELLGTTSCPVECSDALIEHLVDRVTALVNSRGAQPASIEPADYLAMLGRELTILRGESGDAACIQMLVEQIKTFCISSEIYFTQRAAEESPGGTFLYACSSLIDTGLERYIADSGWMMLLRSIGQAKQQFGGTYLRVFFVSRTLFATEFSLRALSQVIRLHLDAGVSVSLVDAHDLDRPSSNKRNMAWIAGRMLLHATDQRRWDLDFKTDPMSLGQALDQHHHFQDIALAVFKSGDQPFVLRHLRAIFGGGDRHAA